jgi:hypothetical protein
MDDSDSKKNKTHKTRSKETIDIVQGLILDARNVLSPVWLRRIIQTNNGYKWFLLDGRCRFLLYFRMLLVILYIAIQIFKN